MFSQDNSSLIPKNDKRLNAIRNFVEYKGEERMKLSEINENYESEKRKLEIVRERTQVEIDRLEGRIKEMEKDRKMRYKRGKDTHRADKVSFDLNLRQSRIGTWIYGCLRRMLRRMKPRSKSLKRS